jgi:hypothetical protein
LAGAGAAAAAYARAPLSLPERRRLGPPARPHRPAPPAPGPTPAHPQGIANAPRRDFLFSEIGLGGADPNGQRAAANLQELAGNPLNGIWAVYNAAQDPWRNEDYRNYRRQWFK